MKKLFFIVSLLALSLGCLTSCNDSEKPSADYEWDFNVSDIVLHVTSQEGTNLLDAGVAGNILDTFVFFSVAFYHCPDPFMAANWVDIGIFDCTVKILCNVILFVPLYGLILSYLAKFVFKRPLTAIGA